MIGRDRDEIRRVFEETYADNIRTKNHQGYGDMYTEDALWMPPNASDRCGREDILEAFDAMVANQDIDPIFVADEIEVMGDVGYVIGISNATIYPSDGSGPKQAKFRALWLMKKDCGQWRISRQIWNNKPVS
ncbi:MAG: SgcJ/EcaC family oxidoreductase [Symploca sp. SIO2B6]|nr:SgcJ/EcaC family oxidoreductase [Symploca sp. SIO2B6]